MPSVKRRNTDMQKLLVAKLFSLNNNLIKPVKQPQKSLLKINQMKRKGKLLERISHFAALFSIVEFSFNGGSFGKSFPIPEPVVFHPVNVVNLHSIYTQISQ